METGFEIMVFLPTRLTLGIEAFQRRYIVRPQVADLDLWVVSPGGVGTTFLMEYLAGFVRINHPYDEDGLKHWPRPPRPAEIAQAPRMLFVTGDAEAIAASIARRDWLTTQSVKLGSLAGTVLKGRAQAQAFVQAVQARIEAWTNSGSDKILTVGYDDLWDRAAGIGHHAGLDGENFAAGFPARRARKSHPESLRS